MKTKIYTKRGNNGLFDEQKTQERLAKIRNPVEKIRKVIDFNMFKEKL